MANINPSDLENTLVTEVGVREPCLFLNFSGDDGKEFRLFIDTDFAVTPNPQTTIDAGELEALRQLLEINGLRVQEVTVSKTADLAITFADSNHVLKVSGTPNQNSSDVWWLASPLNHKKP